MYIDKIDEILDNIVDSTYQTIIKEKLLTKDKYTTQSIKLIVESLINKIDKKFLEEQGLNNNTIQFIIDIFKKLIYIYILVTIHKNFKNNSFVDFIITFKVIEPTIFNSEFNSKILFVKNQHWTKNTG